MGLKIVIEVSEYLLLIEHGHIDGHFVFTFLGSVKLLLRIFQRSGGLRGLCLFCQRLNSHLALVLVAFSMVLNLNFVHLENGGKSIFVCHLTNSLKA